MSELPDSPDNVEVVHEESDVNVGAILALRRRACSSSRRSFTCFSGGCSACTSARTSARRRRCIRWPPASRIGCRRPRDFRRTRSRSLQELRAKQKALLEGYGWVNKEAGVARIPIEDAMKMVVERGLPTREAAK